MTEPQVFREELKRRLYWLVAFRVAFASLLLVVRAVLAATSIEAELVSETAMVVVAVGTTSLISVVLLSRGVVHVVLAYGQLFSDFVVAAALVSWTGGANSPFALLFCVVSISAAPVLGRRQTLVVASLAAFTLIATALLAALRVEHNQLTLYYNPENSLAHFISTLLTQVLAFVAVAYLASKLSAESQHTRLALRVAEGELARSTDFFERVLRSLSSGVLTLDRQGDVAFANPAADRLLGTVKLGRPLADTSAEFAAMVAEGNGDRREGVVHGPLGERTLGFSWVALRDGDEHSAELGRTLLFRDLSQAREAELRAQRNERLAAVGRLAAGIAHEVRNPLGAISGAIELIAQSSAVQENERDLLNICTREVARLSKLVSDFLDFARPAPPSLVSLDVLVAAHDTVALLSNDPRFASRKLAVRGTAVQADGDPGQLRQILLNLIKNALEATPEGGGVDVEVASDGQHVVVWVRDEGGGVPDDQLGKLFEPFFTTKPQGTGLGLALVSQLVRQHAGEVAVKNRVPHGLEVMVRIPKERSWQAS